MTIRQAFKYQLRPTGYQIRLMRRFAGCRRFVYNKAWTLQMKRLKQGKELLSYPALCRLLTQWKQHPETSWLREAPAQCLQQALMDLVKAFRNAAEGHAELPRKRKKGRGDSFRYPAPEHRHVDNASGRVFAPKLGWTRYRKSQDVLGDVKQLTITETCGKWYVSIQTEKDAPQLPAPKGKPVGIDVGVRNFAVLNDGTTFPSCSPLKKAYKRLCNAQKIFSRKKKFSQNWKKQKARLGRLNQKIARIRNDHLHKTSTIISKNHAVACIEDLKPKNMSRSAKGNKDKPGRNTKAKASLNRAILDQGWSEFRRQLGYKLLWNGGVLVAVPPAGTSRTCPNCGHVSTRNRPTQARFHCIACGFEAHADQVGAINILRAGHARLACEVNGDLIPSAAGTHRSDSGSHHNHAWTP